MSCACSNSGINAAPVVVSPVQVATSSNVLITVSEPEGSGSGVMKIDLQVVDDTSRWLLKIRFVDATMNLQGYDTVTSYPPAALVFPTESGTEELLNTGEVDRVTDASGYLTFNVETASSRAWIVCVAVMGRLAVSNTLDFGGGLVPTRVRSAIMDVFRSLISEVLVPDESDRLVVLANDADAENTVVPETVRVYRNGRLLQLTVDYSLDEILNGTIDYYVNLTFTPESGDVFMVQYLREFNNV